jgi:anti-anti-sigma factor
MLTQPLSPLGLKLQLEATSNETIVHCNGKITAENSEVFQRHIQDLIPESSNQIATITRRIIIDLSNVTHVDSTGLGALLRAWTVAQNKGCDLEIANLNPRVEKLVEITRLDTVFKRARVVAAGASGAARPAVGERLPGLEPEEAYQQAFEAGMVVHRAHPLNCETSIPALIGGAVMPNQRFYVRNHFQIPQVAASSWRLI